jgi:hypothetical protein
MSRATSTPQSKSGLVRKSIDRIRPSRTNDLIYRPIDPADPDFLALVASIREHGVLEPLVVTRDGVIVSGHRRHAAAREAGLKTVPCRVVPISSHDKSFVQRLREFNRQRVKTTAEVLREEIVSADPKEAHRHLVAHRRRSAIVSVEPVEIVGAMRRCRISSLKEEMLQRAIEILVEWRDGGYLPGSIRRLHYAMLNDPPMRNKRQRYENNLASYKDLSDLITRARQAGIIGDGYIVDETRTRDTWNVSASPGPFIRQEIDHFLKGYYRDLMQSQPNHIEIICEKLTARQLVRDVAIDYTIPVITARGYPSWPPRREMAESFRASGKQKLVVIAVTDFDPDGQEIVQTLGRSMRDDFGIDEMLVVKACLTHDQVQTLELPVSMDAKPGSSNYDKFVQAYGTDAYELEALPPEKLKDLLRETIDSVIDIDAFNHQVDAEARDAAYLDGVRTRVHQLLAGLDLDDQASHESEG